MILIITIIRSDLSVLLGHKKIFFRNFLFNQNDMNLITFKLSDKNVKVLQTNCITRCDSDVVQYDYVQRQISYYKWYASEQLVAKRN